MASIQEDFDRIDVMLRQLQVKWDMFLNGAGTEKKPPSELQTQVETLIKRLNNSEIRNNGDRFRFQGLSARYTAFNELWQKTPACARGRARLRPPRDQGGAVGAGTPGAQLSFKADDGAAGVPRGDAARDTAAVRALYDHYVEERRRVGEAAPAFESFQALIGKQAQKIRPRRVPGGRLPARDQGRQGVAEGQGGEVRP